jgi:dTDP-4-dehydrorhamnose 3,5-epimerase
MGEPRARAAADRAPRDPATVTRDGMSLRPTIDGVMVKRQVVHVDHRGRVMEIFNHDADFWGPEPVVFTYLATVRPAQIKGWAVHEAKVDRYCIVAGEMLVVLWDGRRDSPTHGIEQAVLLTAEAEQMLRIPIGVWHIMVNVGFVECRLVNHPTKPYDHDNPDRRTLPWNTPEIPVDLTKYLPQQWTA